MQSDSGREECQCAQNAGRYFQLFRAGSLSSFMFRGSGDAESGPMFGFLPPHRYSLWCRLFWLGYNKMIKLFTIRLQRRGYPLNLIQRILSNVKYEFRQQYLTKKKVSNEIPYIFKILYTKQTNHQYLRQQLNNFSYRLKTDITDLPTSLQQKITICYKLPPTLHQKVLKARKAKGF